MANVKVSTQRKEVIKYEEEEVVVLTLSRDEAEAVQSLVGQCRTNGPTSPIFYALQEAGIQSTFRVRDSDDKLIGAIGLVKKA